MKKTLLLGILSITIVILLLFFKGCTTEVHNDTDSKNGKPKKIEFVIDENSTKHEDEEIDKKEIEESLNKKVAESMINISMNTTPSFKDGKSEGNLNIVNNTVNNFPQIVEIVRNDTGEVIYKSNGILVGSEIKTARLSVELPKGEYECTAYFTSVNTETGLAVGTAGAKITIKILN